MASPVLSLASRAFVPCQPAGSCQLVCTDVAFDAACARQHGTHRRPMMTACFGTLLRSSVIPDRPCPNPLTWPAHPASRGGGAGQGAGRAREACRGGGG